MSQVKTQISAAVAIAVGILLASGYVLTLVRLESKGLPTESVLAALPTSFYIGTAIDTCWLPLGIALTAGTVWLLGAWRHAPVEMPPRGLWVYGVIGVSFYALGASQFLYREGFGHAPAEFFVVAGGGMVVMVFIGLAVREVVATLLQSNPTPTKAIRNGLAASAILVLCVLAAVGFRAITVRYLPNAIVQAIVEENPAACPVPYGRAKPVPRQGCGDSGFYVGESADWVYLIDQPSEDPCNTAEFQPNQLVQIAKSEVHRVVLFKEERDESAPKPHCPYPAGKKHRNVVGHTN